MTIGRIKQARALAEAFILKADAAMGEASELEQKISLFGSKKSGALRRASMELTRALAHMRSGSLDD